MDGNATAILTHTYVDTEGTSLAVHDVISCLPLGRRQSMFLFIIRIKALKDILDGTFSAHTSPPFG
jgi:hypothetical protein